MGSQESPPTTPAVADAQMVAASITLALPLDATLRRRTP